MVTHVTRIGGGRCTRGGPTHFANHMNQQLAESKHSYVILERVRIVPVSASNMSCSETLSVIASKFKCYLEELQPDELFALLCKGLQELANFVGELLQICSTNGVVAVELGELEVILNEALAKGRSYINACKDVAEFGSNDELVEAVKADLESGSTDELKEMLETMEGLCQDCRNRLSEFENAYKRATNETKSKMERYEKDADSASSLRKEAMLAGAGGAAVGFVGAVAISGPVGIIIAIGTVRYAAGKVLTGYNAHQLKSVAEQAQSCAKHLHDQLIRTKETVDFMVSEMKNVSSNLERTKGKGMKSNTIIKTMVNLLHKKMKGISTKADESLESLPPTLASLRKCSFLDEP